jgi:hypothetical protein
VSAIIAETRRLFADLHVAERTERRGIARPACALALLLAAGVHVSVGFDHAGSNFGTLSFLAGLVQGALGAFVLVRQNSTIALQSVLLTNLVLIQLYALNVTIGLPAQIGHSHIGGTHEVWLLTLAWPNLVDTQGVIAVVCEIVAIACAFVLGRSRPASTRG